jgi:PAS domain S-box-containing protein
MLEGCQIIDHDWRYAYINESAAKQGRRTKKELLGHTMMEMYPGIENTELFGFLGECMTKRIPHRMENEFIFPDGSRGWFELRIEPVPEGILILSLDVTKRKELEDELNKYRHRLEEVVAERTSECAKANEQLTQEVEAHKKMEEGLMLRALILDNAGEAIFLVNSKGDFVYANEAACKTYGYSRDEFLNMNLSQLLSHPETSITEARLKEVLQKGKVEFEAVHLRKDGSLMQVRVRHSLIKTLYGQFIVSVMRDLTL